MIICVSSASGTTFIVINWFKKKKKKLGAHRRLSAFQRLLSRIAIRAHVYEIKGLKLTLNGHFHK